ncbi:DUF2946 family protein [Amphibiibacter pelophylacis]|uniref:DUF2946 family protein n=1 Tax=Amphibiibacter pelophylacis TaxID=1799477 RepID=A0ACC6NY64_9BURK
MDDLVRAALRKWPNVPACYGWLALDARGDWWMRDDATQARGPFPAAKGSRIQHDKLLGFIARNYAVDSSGAWFFQNGPQRVYVTLEAAPRVWRLGQNGDQKGHVLSHLTLNLGRHPGLDDAPVNALSTVLDEDGRLYAQLAFAQEESAWGVVHPQDLWTASQWLEQGVWPQPQEMSLAALAQHAGFVRAPQPGRVPLTG